MRSRTIKPGFYKNELLAECQPLARILFSSLWGLADREGRLEDRPKKIKAEVLPFDDCDADQLLGELADRGFIQRYSSCECKVIQVLKFAAHQRPHCREESRNLPVPPEKDPAEPRAEPGEFQAKSGERQADPDPDPAEPDQGRAEPPDRRKLAAAWLGARLRQRATGEPSV